MIDRIVGQAQGLHRRTLSPAEGVEDLGGVVALPAKDLHLLLARGEGVVVFAERRA